MAEQLHGRDLAWLERRRAELVGLISGVGDFRRGALNVVWRKCGKPNCACAQPGHHGHGPQYNNRVRLAARHVLDVRRVAHQHPLKPAGFQQRVIHRHRVNARGLHRNMRHTLGYQPARHVPQHPVKRPELADPGVPPARPGARRPDRHRHALRRGRRHRRSHAHR
ncbi:MAG: DUF6788 family protein [Gemmatimonadales bacterium]